ncbi:hypothetical protein DS2_07798 [Catenovulum agarivorans DS-2]|uniref:Uncharacterized protein n=1 Tax=Catenovulum agarivorans DS-2 TaxID=1328313 RepID=W7QYQ4_9ALTE|nr:VCBS domain-containing protein [Catenovulum agarivorans]EWH10520.1 hypothetical protein DS2_07798 [Catenovulum agarivorans DS-2]
MVTDIDSGEAAFNTSSTAQYGNFTITEQGSWTYDLNPEHEKFKAWTSESDRAADSITLSSVDGTTAKLVITINGVDKTTHQPTDGLIYLNEEKLSQAKKSLESKQAEYLDTYQTLITSADKELTKPVDPVTNKILIAASGDIHDYHTIGSYYWPDPTKDDGLPWIYKDGEFNRNSTGPATDWTRRKEMLESFK